MDFLHHFGESSQMITTILIYVVVLGGMYLMMVRPQQKKKKQEEALRKSVQIGDEITTIGGIVGKIVSVREDSDTLVIESGSDKVRIKKWAIGSVEKNN